MKNKHPIQTAVLAVLCVMALLSIIEFFWWDNARTSYPKFLVSAAPSGAQDPLALAKACGDPVEVEPDGTDKALVRCGVWWPARSVWSVPKAYVAPAL